MFVLGANYLVLICRSFQVSKNPFGNLLSNAILESRDCPSSSTFSRVRAQKGTMALFPRALPPLSHVSYWPVMQARNRLAEDGVGKALSY